MYDQHPSALSFLSTNTRPPSAQILETAQEKDVLVQDKLDGGEDVEGVVHYQGLFYVPEIIRLSWLVILALRKLNDLLPEKNTRPAVATDTCPQVMTGAGLLYLPIGKTRVTSQSLSCDRLTRWVRGFIKGFCDGISTGRAPVTIRSWLTKIVHSKPAQMIDAPGLTEVFIDLTVRHGPPRPPWLDCTIRLSRHLKVLVFSVLLPRRQANYDSILIVDRLKKILRDEPVQIPIDAPGLAEVFIPLDSRSTTETQSSPLSSGPPGTTFELDCGYHLRICFEDIEWESHDCMLSTGFT